MSWTKLPLSSAGSKINGRTADKKRITIWLSLNARKAAFIYSGLKEISSGSPSTFS